MLGHPSRRAATLAWVERLGLAAAICCAGWVVFVTVEGETFEREARREINTPRSDPDPPVTVRQGAPIGLLDIPRLGFSEIVAEGDTDDVLRVAIGHLPDTPLPWLPGRSALAGHRDGHFRPLQDIRTGDTIVLRLSHTTLEYVVESTAIVVPSDLSVLTPTRDRYLTLITCYPFSFVGRAPQRFIVHARGRSDDAGRPTARR